MLLHVYLLGYKFVLFQAGVAQSARPEPRFEYSAGPFRNGGSVKDSGVSERRSSVLVAIGLLYKKVLKSMLTV